MSEPTKDGVAAKPQEPMLRDEAIYYLLARIEDSPRGELRISVDHGLFRATYDSCSGVQLPNLTDALCSLIGCMP